MFGAAGIFSSKLLSNGGTIYSANVANLDGTDDYFSVASASVFEPTTTVSFGAWVKCDASPNAFGRIVDKWGSSGNRSFAGYWIASNNRIQMVISDDGTSGHAVLNSTTGLTRGAWYHVVYVYDGSDAYLYLNGAQNATTAYSSATIDVNTTEVRVGSSVGFPSELFKGEIALPFMTKTALSAAQVSEMYNAGTALCYGSLSAGLQTAFNGTNGEMWPLYNHTGFTGQELNALSGTAANDLTNNGSTAFTGSIDVEC